MRSRSRPEWLGGEEEILPAVSTSSLAFQAVLDDLIRTTDLPAAAPGPAPAPYPAVTPTNGTSWSENAWNSDHEVQFDRAGVPPGRLRGRGDLTLVVGLGRDAEAAAAVLAASADAGAEVVHVSDRRDALAARADGVRRDIPLVAAYALAGPAAVPAVGAELAGIAPDQVWVAVDVSRKQEDTAAWVRAVDAVLAVDAVAATGAALTASPDDVHRLGLPVLWLEAPPGG